MRINTAEAGQLRMERGLYQPASRPSQRRSGEDSESTGRVTLSLSPTSLVRAAGTAADPHVVGLASVTEEGYEMWDWAGPYTEIVALDAFDKTLAADPLVEFTLNHNRGGGLPMAHTRNGTLTLEALKDAGDGVQTGLSYEASVDPTRGDVADMLKALDRGDLAEASFKFTIIRGQWSPDYMEFRINEVDLHRGDVSAVNFGANPAATSGLRGVDAHAIALEVVQEITRGKAPVRIDEDEVEHRTIAGI